MKKEIKNKNDINSISIEELESNILQHKILYEQGSPTISDYEYDQLEEILRQKKPDSYVLSLVGTFDAQKENEKILHKRKMLSLAKCYKVDELFRWMEKKSCVGVYKIDGMSCSLIYKNHKLVMAKSRGDGQWGEHLLQHVQWIKDIPNVLSKVGDCEVRGEIFCTEENFFLLSQEMLSLHYDRPSSPRNIVAGLMGRKESLFLCRHLSFFAFDISDEDPLNQDFFEKHYKLTKEKEKILFLNQIGFQIPPYCFVEYLEDHAEKKILSFIGETQEHMQNGHYGIDGLVWTLDDLKLHRLLGETAHHPRYRLAFKFEGDFKRTTIKEIEWNISRQGILTPVAIVDEVELNGAKVSRVTLHHAGLVIELNLKKNDVIEIIRSGDVIPKLSKVILSAVGTSTYPDQCPICSSPTKLESIRLFCSLDQCPGKQLEEMIDFVQKIGIESIGPRRLEEMMKKGILKEIPDLFLIKEEQLYVLDKVKEKMAKKMIFQIEKAKTLDLLTLWGALGIKGSAKNSCEKIIHAGFNTLDKIMKLNKADLMMVEGFAEKSADHFLNSWEEKKRLVRTLKKIGVVIQDHSGDLKTNAHSKEVLNFCITGTLSLPRKDIEKKIIQHGHKLQTQVTKSTNYLVANKEEHSSKYQMALKLSIPIIKEEDLEKIL